MSTNAKTDFDKIVHFFKTENIKLLAITALAFLVIGVIAGGAMGSAEAKADAAKTPVVVQTQEPIAVETTTPEPVPTVTETVSNVPDACLTALDDADRGFGYAADSTDAWRDAVNAAAYGDVDALNEATKQVKKQSDRLERLAPKYNAHKITCQSAALD